MGMSNIFYKARITLVKTFARFLGIHVLGAMTTKEVKRQKVFIPESIMCPVQ